MGPQLQIANYGSRLDVCGPNSERGRNEFRRGEQRPTLGEGRPKRELIVAEGRNARQQTDWGNFAGCYEGEKKTLANEYWPFAMSYCRLFSYHVYAP